MILVFTSTLNAQPEKLGTLTVNDGLSQGMIHDMLQCQNGYMWLGTKDGLNRFDGHNFKIFKSNDELPFSISGDWICTIYEDHRGLLWIETSNRDFLNIFDPATERFYKLRIFNAKEWSKDWSNFAFGEDANRQLWIGSLGKIWRLNIPEHFLSMLSQRSPNEPLALEDFIDLEIDLPEFSCSKTGEPVKDIVRDFLNLSDNRFLASTLEKVIEIDAKSGEIKTLATIPAERLKLKGISFIKEDKTGSVWFSVRGKIIEFDGEQTTIHQSLVFENRSISPIVDSFGNIYFTFNGSLWFISKASFEQRRLEPIRVDSSSIGVASILMNDDSDILWVTDSGYGLVKYNLTGKNFKSHLPGKSISSLQPVQKEGTLAIRYHGSRKGGLYDLLSKEYIENPMDDLVFYFQDKEGFYWQGNKQVFEGQIKSKLVKLNGKKEVVLERAFSNLDRSITFLFENHKGELWGLLNEQLVKIDKATAKIKIYEKEDNVSGITYLMEDSNHDLYGNYSEGLLQIKFSEAGIPEEYVKYPFDPKNPTSISHNEVLSICDDPLYPNRFLWVGTRGGGLNKFDKEKGEFNNLDTKDGLPDDVIYGLLSDNSGHLWMSTNKGICRYHPRSREIRNFGLEDGLQSLEFNSRACAKMPSGKFVFGGVNGFNSFHPDSIKFNDFQPNLIITSLKINNKEIAYTLPSEGMVYNNPNFIVIDKPKEEKEAIVLQHDQNLITFEYASMDFTYPDRNRFKYLLEGHDKAWNDVGTSRMALYSSLPPGDYIFKVQGTNSSGIWSDKIAEVRLQIKPPWWKSNLAYFSYAVLFFSFLFGIYQFQLQRMKLENQLSFEKKEARRLIEMDELKTNFFSNITHEFRTPLTLIIEPIRQLLKEYPAKPFSSQIRLVKKNAEQLLFLVNQLLDLSKIENNKMKLINRRGNVVEVIRPIFQSFLILADQKGIDLKMKVDKNINEFYFDKDKLEKVIYNLLSNAIKFTEEGIVELKMSTRQNQNTEEQWANQLVIEINDSGIGISKEHLANIFDRFYQVDGSDTRKAEGTGIGLSLVSELVELMKASIKVKSEINQGTSFEVVMPMIEELETTSFKQEMIAPAGLKGSPIVLLGNSKVQSANSDDRPLLLVVEDNSELRTFIKLSLESKYQIIEASNGQEGVEQAIATIPDLIISDLMMPKKNGLELTNELKHQELTAHIPIIILTARGAMDSKIQGLKSGADAYLVKPFHTEELLVRIEKLIEVRRVLQAKYKNESLKGNQELIAEFSKVDNSFLRKIIGNIHEGMGATNFSVEYLAGKMFMSRSQLFRKMKALTGMSPVEYIRNVRLDRAKELLENKEGNVNEIASVIGFSDDRYFSVKFKERFGRLPSEIKKNGLLG